MDRTDEVGKEGICSVCGEKKFIRASWDNDIFCDQCFDAQGKNHDKKD